MPEYERSDVQWWLTHGSSANMLSLGDRSIDLVVTSPPYFPEDISDLLKAGRVTDRNKWELRQKVLDYAWDFRKNFQECFRVLKPGSYMIVQTRDVRLKDALVNVEGVHRHLIEGVGFYLYTKYLWFPAFNRKEKRDSRTNLSNEFGPTCIEPEVFLVFRKSGELKELTPTDEDIGFLSQGIVTSGTKNTPYRHEHQSPVDITSACIRTYSRKFDTVLDCFAGGGTVLALANLLGRNSVGYEIDKERFDNAKKISKQC